MKKLIYLLVSLLLLILMHSCIQNQLGFDDIKGTPWDAQWAFPILNTSLELSDILNDTSGFIHEDENGLLSLVYASDSLVSIDAGQLIGVPDQNVVLEETFDLPNLPPGEELPPIPFAFNFPFETDQEGQRIDSLHFKSGIYHLEINTNLNKDQAYAEVIIQSLKDRSSGEPLSFNIDLSNPSGGTMTWESNIDLADYVLEMTGVPENTLNISCELNIITDDNPNNSPYQFSLTSRFDDLEFNYIFGYFARYTTQIGDTIYLDIFKLNQEGYFEFGPGSVNFLFTFHNSYGLPIDLDMVKARAYHGGDQPSDSVDINLFGEGIPNIIPINYPSLNQLGELVETEVNGENSNIHEALNISPDKLEIVVNGTLNPEEDPGINNFVLYDSKFMADIELELELFGAASGFRIADTLDFSMDLGGIESLNLIFDIENGFPIDASLWLHLLDSTDNKIYEILSPEELLVAGGETGGEENGYKVVTPGFKLTEIPLDKDGIFALKNATKIVVNAEVSTTNGQLAKIYSDYGLKVKVGANLGVNY